MSDYWRKYSTPVRNDVSFLYIVGVEGVGHHGVTPAVASIAKTCNYHIIFGSTVLRRFQYKLLPKSYASTIASHRHAFYPGTTKVLVVEDSSFPADKDARNSTAQKKKSLGKYNLEWVYDRAVEAKASPRFLYLTRDFYRAVASHPEFDDGFEPHAQVLHDFTTYIHSEYEAISRKQPGIWGQVHYEWFAELRNCTALVSAIIDFAGWDHCDVEYACQVLRQTLRNSTARAVNATQYAYAQTFNITSPVPLLDISENRSYSFRTVVSPRQPFKIVQAISTQVRGARPNIPGLFDKKSPGLAVRATRHPAAGHTPVQVAGVEHVVASHSTYNKVTLVYLVGVLGAGHEVVRNTLIAAARVCGYHVIHDHAGLRRAQANIDTKSYVTLLHGFQRAVYRASRKVLVLDGAPFFADGERPLGTLEEKRKNGKFNMLWVHARSEDAGVEVKFLYLSRTFSEVLRVSFVEGAVSFAEHARSVCEFQMFINEEWEVVEAVQPGLWAQVQFERLVNASSSCDDHVSELMVFLGAEDCYAASCRPQGTTKWFGTENRSGMISEERSVCNTSVVKPNLPTNLV
jgi:hypothetical protein